MPDPVTGNVALAVPVRGTDTGTWDTPVNGNFTSIDSMFGGVCTLALSSAPVTLLTSQAYCNIIRLTGTLTANIAITLPSIYKFWTIDNQITNFLSFTTTLVSTSGASVLGVPPITTDVFYDGTTINYHNFGKLGEYWDYCATSVPPWVTSCTKPPWLNCNGTTFSSATYPQLFNLLGGGTLPDSRGRVRAAMSAGTARLTSVISDVLFNAGGDQLMQSHTHTGSGTTGTENQNHDHNYTPPSFVGNTGGGGAFGNNPGATTQTGVENQAHNHNFSFTTAATGGGLSQNVQPTYLHGITMIRAN
jgi:hypothetical protein